MFIFIWCVFAIGGVVRIRFCVVRCAFRIVVFVIFEFVVIFWFIVVKFFIKGIIFNVGVCVSVISVDVFVWGVLCF